MKYTLIRSRRKTIAVQIENDLSIVVKVPRWLPKYEVDRFVNDKSDWIEKTIEKIKVKNEQKELNRQPALTEAEVRALADEALVLIPERVRFFAPIVGVDYGRVTIRNQKTRWGSCSTKGNLNFNCLLMLTPPEIIDYVVVHELCHRKEMNHSKLFWNEVEKVLPDYKTARKWLRDNGSVIMDRIR